MRGSTQVAETFGIEIAGHMRDGFDLILNPPALAFIANLHRRFNPRREALLARRIERQRSLEKGSRPNFLPETSGVRVSEWRIAAVPHDLRDRRVEITGPVDRKMVINALNSGARTFMADFEDSCSPTWDNLVHGQINLHDAVRGTIAFTDPGSGKEYALKGHPATLIVRPRGWHLIEKHMLVDGEPVSASIFDFALYFYHNVDALQRKGSGPYFYLPKTESHLEARLWNDIFEAAQESLGVQRGTIKATVLIETILAAFEMDEILYELREHSAGLNCGRWDYIFSFIKKFRQQAECMLPDRALVTMDRHFLKSYVDLLIKTCHRRGAHAMGGMAAQIPIKNDPQANAAAMQKVYEDKSREARAGHDGTWIAHPGLAPVALDAFGEVMTGANQLDVLRPDVNVTADDLLAIPDGEITEEGVRHNIRVGIQYLAAWLGGNGCVPLYNLMEDAATAEICRAQIWQWIRHGARLSTGARMTREFFQSQLAEIMHDIHEEIGAERYDTGHYSRAARLFAEMILKNEFDEFLTLPAYDYLD